MNVFKRLLKIGQAEIHSAVDKMEDPIRMTEQGVRDMRIDLDNAIEASAKVKAMAIRTKNDKLKKMSSADDYRNKAILLMSKAQKEELELDKAELLAKEALAIREALLVEIQALEQQQTTHEAASDEIQKNVEILRFNIAKWENELKTLRARVKVSKANKEVNKQMAQLDSNSTIAMLERMKEKVEEEEALAQAYGDLAHSKTSIDDEINKAIGKDADNVADNLDEIKRNLGMI